MHFLHQQSSDTNLATIMKAVVGHSSYSKKLTVKVLCSDPATTYIYDKKEKREMMNTVVADSSKVVKCVVNDAKKFHRFKAGTTIILRNIIRKKLSQVRQWYFLHHKPSTSHHIWRRKGWPFCIPPPRWCEICGRSFGISHAKPTCPSAENYSGLYPNRSKKDTCGFFS